MSLVPLHDDEFFRGPPHTAFRTHEISDMVKTLRDICMGIVRFMYPEKQIGHQAVAMNEDDESMSKNLRLQKQTEIARQKASKFSFVFKVNFNENEGRGIDYDCLDHCAIIATITSERCSKTILSTG